MSSYAVQLAAHQQKYTQAIAQARHAGVQDFTAWFNREAAQDATQAMVRGFWDFGMHILTPPVCARLDRPERRSALEIGYGGGRLLYAASHFFGWVHGVDIHAEAGYVAQQLRAAGRHNIQLYRTSGDVLPIADASVDLIYSFIVLQHLPRYAVLVRYLHETRRCLRVGGVAQLYFGRFGRLHALHQVRWWWRGYREVPHATANQISLVVRVGVVRRLCATLGLQVIAHGSSYYRVPDGYPTQRGGQSYVTLYKD